MATGIFTAGFTEAEVLAIQSKAKEALLAGRVTMAYSDSGTSVTKGWTMPVKEVLDECLYALRVLNPSAYPRPSNTLRHNLGARFIAQ